MSHSHRQVSTCEDRQRRGHGRALLHAIRRWGERFRSSCESRHHAGPAGACSGRMPQPRPLVLMTTDDLSENRQHLFPKPLLQSGHDHRIGSRQQACGRENRERMALALMKGEIGKPVRRLIPEPFQGSFGRNRHPM
uniref:Uncharacterized protein n=1 Tax=Cereibacter sphaeroides (strain ATCC 17025 / ATH 2.4.3) TaxID=349102 RepID=A4X092_CERS5